MKRQGIEENAEREKGEERTAGKKKARSKRGVGR